MNEMSGGFAMPMMRGFPCPVTTPMMGANDGPPEGIGCGWSNVNGMGPQFFITIHAEGGFAMIAQLDYARYTRFAQNYATMGQQALVTGKLDEIAYNDPLEALRKSLDAMCEAVVALRKRKMHALADALDEPIAEAKLALGLT